MHRQTINRGRVAYEPNSLGGGCPFQAGKVGFTSFPQPIDEDKVRGKPEKFADHYTQAALFYNSQTPVEQAHIMRAFRFELTKVQVPAIRERVVSQLANVNADLARRWRKASASPCQGAARAACREYPAGSEDLAGAVAVRAAGRRQHSHAARRDAGGGRCQMSIAAQRSTPR